MTDPIQLPELMPTVGPGSAVGGAGGPEAPKGKDFKSLLLESLEQVNRLQAEADDGVQKLLTGETDNVSEVLAAVNKAGIAFDLLMEIRNKLTEAYQEIRQMQI